MEKALIAALPAFLATSQRADAAFGPAGGAVLSKPPLQQLDFEALINLSPEKLAQRVGAISGAGIDAWKRKRRLTRGTLGLDVDARAQVDADSNKHTTRHHVHRERDANRVLQS